MPAVVSDSSPLISLAQLGLFGLLREFYAHILVPPAVQQELLARGLNAPGVAEMSRAIAETWMLVKHPRADVSLPHTANSLDAGERDAIELALQEKADLLLIDEVRG